MLQAMNTGHDGSITTVHANSPRDSLSRLETMVLMAGIELPERAIREQMASAIDLIVHQSRLKDGTRRITHITEVDGMEGDIITLQDVFAFDFHAGVDEHGPPPRHAAQHRAAAPVRRAPRRPRHLPAAGNLRCPRATPDERIADRGPGGRVFARVLFVAAPRWRRSARAAATRRPGARLTAIDAARHRGHGRRRDPAREGRPGAAVSSVERLLRSPAPSSGLPCGSTWPGSSASRPSGWCSAVCGCAACSPSC